MRRLGVALLAAVVLTGAPAVMSQSLEVVGTPAAGLRHVTGDATLAAFRDYELGVPRDLVEAVEWMRLPWACRPLWYDPRIDHGTILMPVALDPEWLYCRTLTGGGDRNVVRSLLRR